MSDHTIDTGELAGRLGRDDFVLIDVRPMAAFNGWALRQEPRGGHVHNAVAFPFDWTANENWSELLHDKGITPRRDIIVYGYESAETDLLVRKLESIGYSNVRTFDQFFEWSADATFPMDHLSRYPHLVYPDWLHRLIAGDRPPTFTNNDFVICHAAFDHREDYEEGHIPGAVYLETLSLESPKTWNRRSPDELKKALLDLGVRHDITVIVYGRESQPDPEDFYPGRYAGQLAAMRSALILLYAGVRDVRVLDGGLAAWERAGYDLTTSESIVHPASDFGVEIPAHPEYIIDLPEAKELLASSDGELVSMRSWKEFIGDVSGYNYITKGGRIAGAVFGNCGSDAYHMENYRNFDQTLRSYHEIAAAWAEIGIVPEKRIAFCCGTGWRASEAFFHAWLMGWPRVSIYDGGWFEWSADPANPVETGPPK